MGNSVSRASGAFLSVIGHTRNEKGGQHAEDSTTTNVMGVDDSFASTEPGDRVLVVKGVAVEDRQLVCKIGISGTTDLGAKSVGVRAEHGYLLPLVHDAVEVGNNLRNGVIPEISLVEIVGMMDVDVCNSERGKPSGLKDATRNDGILVNVRAEDPALLELEFTFGGIGDGDGDGTGIGDDGMGGIGGGLNAVVEPGDSEHRDRIEGESPWAVGREIV